MVMTQRPFTVDYIRKEKTKDYSTALKKRINKREEKACG